MAVGTVLGIVLLVTTIATKSIEAGMSKKAGDEEDEFAREQERLGVERSDKMRKQQERSTDIQGLERQLSKRRGAEKVARQVPGAQPITRGKLEMSPPSTASAPPAPTTTPASRGISPEGLEAIGGGVELAGQVASGITSAAAASQASKAREEEAARLAKLQEEEFQKNLAAKTRDVNLRGLDYQSQAAAGPGASARQNTFASDFMNTLRNIKNPRKVA